MKVNSKIQYTKASLMATFHLCCKIIFWSTSPCFWLEPNSLWSNQQKHGMSQMISPTSSLSSFSTSSWVEFIHECSLFICSSIYPHIHIGNTLLVDNTPYKSMFNGQYSVLFSTPLTTVMGKTSISWGLFSLTWKTFIYFDTMFPPLLNTIPLVGLNVLIKIIQDF